MPKKPANDVDAALENEAKRLQSIRKIVAQSDKHYMGYQERLTEALVDIYGFTLELTESKLIEAFVLSHDGFTWGKVARDNHFQPVAKLAFEGSASPASASKYSTVLAYAHESGIAPDKIKDWLAEGIEERLAQARSSSAFDTYDETPEERLTRALSLLSAPVGKAQAVLANAIPPISGDTPNAAISDFRKALVRIVGGKLEIVKVLQSSAAELESEIVGTVPKDPLLGRRKLTAKAYYDVFCACDLMSRFARGADASDLSGYAVPKKGTPDYEIWQKSVEAKGKAKKSKSPPSTSLRITHEAGGWIAEMVSTRPTFPAVRYKLDSQLDHLDPAKIYAISRQQAERIADGFIRSAEWTLRVRKQVSGGADIAGETEIVLDEFDPKLAWNQLGKLTAFGASFGVDADTFRSMRTWNANFKEVTGSSLPGLIGVRVEKSELTLFPAGNSDAALARRLSLVKADAKYSSAFSSRWLLRDDLLQITSINEDYGRPMTCSFLDGNEKLAGLQVEFTGATITVPLVVSLGGDYAEIAAPV
ncbi:hypothetical protein [uncultured Devosia sp.]|uniref:hypothetical protein n=1 Tax=uncultured Devosia sp. TaxID=211434 RepID=UPI0035C98843